MERCTSFIEEFFNSIWSSDCDSNESLVQIFGMFVQFEVLYNQDHNLHQPQSEVV